MCILYQAFNKLSRTIFHRHKKTQHTGWVQIWCFDSHFVFSSSTTYACLLAWTKVLWLGGFDTSHRYAMSL